MRYKSPLNSHHHLCDLQSFLVCALSCASVRLNTLICNIVVISLIRLHAMWIIAVKLITHSIKYKVGSSIIVVPNTNEK
jgi:hypothetical protein